MLGFDRRIHSFFSLSAALWCIISPGLSIAFDVLLSLSHVVLMSHTFFTTCRIQTPCLVQQSHVLDKPIRVVDTATARFPFTKSSLGVHCII